MKGKSLLGGGILLAGIALDLACGCSAPRAPTHARAQSAPAAVQGSVPENAEIAAARLLADHVAEVFRDRYAPSELKSRTMGWSLEGELRALRNTIDAQPSPSRSELQRAFRRFFQSPHDIHTFIAPVDERAVWLGVHLLTTDAGVRVAWIDPKFAPQIPLAVGDEITTFDGEPTEEAIQGIAREDGLHSTPGYELAYAERFLGVRSMSDLPTIPRTGSRAVLGVRRKGEARAAMDAIPYFGGYERRDLFTARAAASFFHFFEGKPSGLTAPHFEILPEFGPDPARGPILAAPILMLIDSIDHSAADYVPATLQDNHRGVLFGTNTAGAGGNQAHVGTGDVCTPRRDSSHLECAPPAVIAALKTLGFAGFYYTVALGVRPGDRVIENVGVSPDVPYRIQAEDLLSGFAPMRRRILDTLETLTSSTPTHASASER